MSGKAELITSGSASRISHYSKYLFLLAKPFVQDDTELQWLQMAYDLEKAVGNTGTFCHTFKMKQARK